jgi:hypothetical protein
MDIIEIIVNWAANQPLWQQLLISELLSGNQVDDGRIKYYASQALEQATDEKAYTAKVGNPLEEYDDYTITDTHDGVKITAIIATQNINAIADGTKLPVNKIGLNMIYGNNASGKSGYTRILKNSCNCRHNEQLRGNVNRDHTKECIANIIYEVNGSSHDYRLDDKDTPNVNLKSVNVFDSKSGHNYLVTENDIVFMPAGMDVLDSLSTALEKINQQLKDDLAANADTLNELGTSFAEYEGTKAHELIGDLSNTNALDNLNVLKVLTLDEQQEIITLSKEIILRQTKSPQKVKEGKQQLYTKLNSLLTKMTVLKNSLQKVNIDRIITERDQALKLRATANEASKKRFENKNFIGGTGNDLWVTLWEAASEFSQKSAYLGHEFPHIAEGAKCVLCQQTLAQSSQLRFEEFVKFVSDKSQSEAKTAEGTFKTSVGDFARSNLDDEYFEGLAVNLSYDDYEDIAQLIKEASSAREIHKKYLGVFNSKDVISEYENLNPFELRLARLSQVIKELAEEIAKPLDDDEFRRELQSDRDRLKELKSKAALGTYEKNITKNINTHNEMKLLQKAIAMSKTFAVSSKIGDISEKLIIEKLAERFNTELDAIFLGKISARLSKARTVKGVPSSAIVLTGESGDFKGDSLEKIMSEGEQRGVALAGFFAELTISPNGSAIVLDDPVTSLDHLNVERIAKRIAEESLVRQVIVFTHNVLFASELEQAVEKVNGTYTARAIEKLSSPGIVRETLPFDTMKTAERLDFLTKRINPLKVMYNANDEKYKAESESFYKDLRRTWERAIEERLLNNVVTRYRRDIKPGNVMTVTVTDDDKNLIADNMEICAKFMHDPAAETGGNETPSPDDLNKDLQTITNWTNELKQRHKSAEK